MTETILSTISNLPGQPETKVAHLPGEKGLPFFGQTFEFLSRATELVERLQKKHGDLFQYHVLRSRAVVFASPDDAEMILKDKTRNFSNRKGWYRMTPLFDRGILLRDFEDHKTHRRTLQQAFGTAAMETYGDNLNSLIKTELENWPVDQEFLFAPKIKSLLLDNAAALFLGAELGAESDKLNQSFVDLLGGLLALFKLNLPGTAWYKSQAGKSYIKDWLYKRVDQRLQSEGSDFFSSLSRESRNPEHPMSVDDVVQHTLLLLFAAHDTTTGTLSAIMSLLCEHPQWQEKLRAEIMAFDGDTLPFGRLNELTLTDQVFREALRLFPPVFLIPRRAIEAFNHNGHDIPSNAAIHLQVYLIHRSAKYWSRPNSFDPDRFSPERAEHKQHRYQYIPFGAGAHTCLGIRFAEAQVKIFLFHFLRRFKAESREGRSTQMRTVPIPIPKDNLPLKLRRL